MSISRAGPFQIKTHARDRLRRTVERAALPVVERALALPALNDVYTGIRNRPERDLHFATRSLLELGMRTRLLGLGLEGIPKTGPLVVVANHPFGGIEGLILCDVLRRVRPDVKLLANYMLSVIPDLSEDFFYVDPFGGPESARRNMASMRAATDWVERGGVLGIFPSGEVSHLRLRQRRVVDPPWSKTVGKIVKRTGATVVPVFFYGRNSLFFQLAGMIHPRVRTSMLVREMLRKRGRTCRLRVGSPITPHRLKHFADPQALTSYLRVRTYILKARDVRHERQRRLQMSMLAGAGEPIVEAESAGVIADQIAALPDEQRLFVRGPIDVVIGSADQFPAVLREIGRLREMTFRRVGEGTGRSIDLDRFDKHYLHLLAWDRQNGVIVGAYRLGLTDKVLPVHGVDGLYTSTLFHFKKRLIEQISPAIELGRSFVHPDYQKRFAPLMLLWQGIGRFIAQHMHYRHMFGTVSISAEYTSMSRQLLMTFLQNQRAVPKLQGLITPRNPPRKRPNRNWDPAEFSTVVSDIADIDELIGDLEADGKMMPVLLRQYLKLNGKLLGLNIDPEFGNVLDGLMLFDVLDMPSPILKKYLGAENIAPYMARHNAAHEPAAVSI